MKESPAEIDVLLSTGIELLTEGTMHVERGDGSLEKIKAEAER